uniref:Reverse transcriptase domain-containing protein n=1 Tax=Nothobranchius furzeri TaxID=105023 RepID=A0A8C6M6P6_NOTFU
MFEVFLSGFRSGHSTESALLRVLNDIYLSLGQGTSVVLLLLDPTAAFDTVEHVILLDRLERWVGIKGSALDWFRSYLQNRTFCVKLGDVFSSWEGLRWGVPQGSILGPLLFTIYLLPLGSSGPSLHLYADDCQIYSPLCQEKGHSIQSFVSCINEVNSWLTANYLHLNEGIVFHPNSRNVGRHVDLGPLSPYSKPVVTSLGVKIDAGLKFDAHINSVIRSSFFHLRRLAKIKHMVSRAHLERVLHAFVISRLDYCNSLYAGLCQSSLRRLQVVQNSAARFLTGTRKRDHISPVLASLHWLLVCYHSHFKLLIFVYNFFQSNAPPYLATLLNRHSPSRALRSSDQGLLAVPRSRCRTRGDQALSVLPPSLWNQLPPSVRLSPSLPVFKSRLKTHLLRLAFPERV